MDLKSEDQNDPTHSIARVNNFAYFKTAKIYYFFKRLLKANEL